jgi:hypothetical protein
VDGWDGRDGDFGDGECSCCALGRREDSEYTCENREMTMEVYWILTFKYVGS